MPMLSSHSKDGAFYFADNQADTRECEIMYKMLIISNIILT
jgi:hypothetical protein